jgi:hypothetical protein
MSLSRPSSISDEIFWLVDQLSWHISSLSFWLVYLHDLAELFSTRIKVCISCNLVDRALITWVTGAGMGELIFCKA